MVGRDSANFSRGGQIFKRTADKISFGPVLKKNGKIDYKNKSVIDLSIICRISYDKRVTELRSVYSKGKNCLLQQNSKILKRHSINPGNWRWNPLANYAGWSYEQIRR